MAKFNTNDDKYIVRINGGNGHGKPFTDPDHGQEDSIQLDLLRNRHVLGHGPDNSTVCTNVPLEALLGALNTIEGVTATYEKPKVRIPVPQGIGAVVAMGGAPHIKLTRVRNAGQKKTWAQNLSDKTDSWYTDAEVEELLNVNDYVVLSEGVQP